MKEIPWRGANAASQLNLKIYYSLEFVVSLSFLNWARIRSATTTIGDVKYNVKWFPYKVWRHVVDKILRYAIAFIMWKKYLCQETWKYYVLIGLWHSFESFVVSKKTFTFHSRNNLGHVWKWDTSRESRWWRCGEFAVVFGVGVKIYGDDARHKW